MPNGIFVSYRRSDSSGHAGRIYDRLKSYYGDHGVFRDIEDILAGDDFVQTIRETIGKYEIVLVVIGPTWLTVSDEHGQRRIDNQDDVVRLEVAAALGRSDVRVIPVLVNGAKMPRGDQLPAALTSLANRNAVEVLDTRFNADVDSLIKSMGGKRAGWLKNFVVTGIAAAVMLAAGGVVLIPLLTAKDVAATVTYYEGGGELAGNDRDELRVFSAPPPDSIAQNDTAESPANTYRAPITVTYDYQRTGNSEIAIASRLPYRDLVEQGGPIEGGTATLYWDWPALSVKVVNNSDRVIHLSEIHLTVEESEIDSEPLVMVRQRLWQRTTFSVVNYGWGNMVDPEVSISIVKEDQCRENDWQDLPRQSVNELVTEAYRNRYAGTESSDWGAPGVEAIYNVGSILPATLRQDLLACVFGVIDYHSEMSGHRSIQFKTFIMINGTAPNAAVSISEEFLIFLEAGKSGYTKSVPISLEVAPASVEHFLMRIGTDKSASFEVSVSLGAVGEDPIEADKIVMDILTPVYDPLGLRNAAQRR